MSLRLGPVLGAAAVVVLSASIGLAGSMKPQPVSADVTATAATTVTATATATATTTATATATASPTPAPVAILTTTLPDAQVGVGYVQALSATGGTAPYTWSLTGGALPAGLTLSANGVISGTPTTVQSATFSVLVVDSTGSSASGALTINVNASAALTITTTSLPDAAVGAAYSQTLGVSGGTTPYAWTLISGALPPGLTLDSTTGTLAGTPTTAGTYPFSIAVTDAAGSNVSQAYSLNVVAGLSVQTTTLTNATVGSAYSQTLVATGGTTPYTWQVTSGSLPAGITLNSAAGTLSGTPTTTGSSTFTVQATDAAGRVASQQVTLTVVAAQGHIVTGSIPSDGGFGLIVYSGGSVADLVTASGCTAPTLAFWVTSNGAFVGYVPGTTVSAVNADFLALFPGGILPPNTPLIARCM